MICGLAFACKLQQTAVAGGRATAFYMLLPIVPQKFRRSGVRSAMKYTPESCHGCLSLT